MELTAVRQSDLAHPRADVVFVHGLDGDARSTWQAKVESTFFWPSGLADELPDHSVWTLGYAAPVSSWRSASSPLLDLATDALSALEAHGIGEYPLFFIAHSFGGLLVKQMLRHATSYGNARWQALHDQVCGIVFLATPHAGATAANWVLHLRGVLRTSVSVKELEAHNPQLRDLNLWFRSHAQEVPIPLQVYCERQPTHGLLVVDPTSGDPGITGVTPILVDADHTSIAKPRDRSATLCLRVRRFIEECSATTPGHADRFESRLPSGAGAVLHSSTAEQPSGTVTMLFSDIEGSTRLVQRLGRDQYAEALELHRRLLREAFGRHDGFEVDCEGDAFFVAFPTAGGAVAAAAEAERALAAVDWSEGCELRVRMGLHTGEPLLAPPKYMGLEVHRAARIMAAGHGGQVLLSQATRDLLEPDVSVRDLGEHRLQDLSAPERIYQLGSDVFPPLKTLHQTNLPIPSTPFLGRERELQEVLGLLSRDDVRLLTLTGTGGTGKTRLAAQVAGLAADDYPDGVWWVPLAPLRDPELVLAAAGQALGSKSDLAEHIAGRRLLLLLDNFEHLIDAADDLAALLTTCPNLDLLVTSREPLHVTGEQEYPVPSLAPDEGVDFFLARARAIKPDFQMDDSIAEICRRLDDLPLALELAAARVKAFSPAQILARLEQRLPLLTGGARDLPERHRTLRATIAWGHELLSPSEQLLLARLSVFRGGCTLEAVEHVADADLDVLQALVDKSLLRRSGDRFWMLETIREFAAEQLERSDEARELGRRHADHFLRLAEEAEPNLRGSESTGEWLGTLEREHENLRAALDWLESTSERQLALRLAGALSQFWYLRGPFAEGAHRLASLLRASDEATPARAKALRGAAVLAIAGGDAATGRLHAEEASAVYRKLEDTWGIAHAGFLLGHAAADEGMLPDSERHFEESVRLFRELGDEYYTLLATANLAEVAELQGDLERARDLYHANLVNARRLSEQRIVALSLLHLASYGRVQSGAEDPLSMLAESLGLFYSLGSRTEIVETLSRFASTLALTGKAETAVKLLACSEAQRNQIGTASLPLTAERNEETLTAIRRQLDEVGFARAWEQGQALTIDEAVALAFESSDTPQHPESFLPDRTAS